MTPTPPTTSTSTSTTATTNEEDQREAAALRARLCQNIGGATAETLAATSTNVNRNTTRIPSVSIDPGKHKYVLISACLRGNDPDDDDDDQRQHYFVVSSRGAEYHRNVAEPFVARLEKHASYKMISILGGGRIDWNVKERKIHVYGYSYGFGLADHSLAQSILQRDPNYQDYTITWSNDGY